LPAHRTISRRYNKVLLTNQNLCVTWGKSYRLWILLIQHKWTMFKKPTPRHWDLIILFNSKWSFLLLQINFTHNQANMRIKGTRTHINRIQNMDTMRCLPLSAVWKYPFRYANPLSSSATRPLWQTRPIRTVRLRPDSRHFSKPIFLYLQISFSN
jgi:hypothetical protein